MSAQTDLRASDQAKIPSQAQVALLRLAEYFAGSNYQSAVFASEDPARAGVPPKWAIAFAMTRQYLGLFGDVGLPEAIRVIRKTLGARPEVDQSTMREQWRALQRQVHDTALAHGWWDEPVSLPVTAALVHCEVSEVVEADRAGNPPSQKIPAFTSVEEELADIVIRVLDLSEANGFRLFEAIQAKAAYNQSRPFGRVGVPTPGS